jgi:predicted AAA+ superfamily ATPase
MNDALAMYIKRTITEFLIKASRQFPVLLVTGPRQVGKTTCLQHTARKDRAYVTLDDPQSRALARDDPGLFLQRFEPPVLIDEIQYAPELLPLIKIAVDRNKKGGDYWLIGSQQFHMMANVSESLAGRVGILQLLGFSSRELAGRSDWVEPFSTDRNAPSHSNPLSLMALYERIWRGSFPAMTPRNLKAPTIGEGSGCGEGAGGDGNARVREDLPDRDLFYSSYVQTYLQRDVRSLANVGDEIAFLKFLRAAAGRTGQILNMTDISRDAGIAPNTAKKWLSILKASGIIYLLEPYHTNLTKRMVKAPKLYFLDTGLAAYLTEWSSYKTLEAGAMSGAIFETWVINEIIKSYWHAGNPHPSTITVTGIKRK